MTQDRTRQILAANLSRLIERDSAAGQRPSVRAWALGKGLDVRMIARLAKGEHAVTLDKLAEIADACGLQPWHLLYDDLDPTNPPDAPVSDEDRKMLAKLRRLLDQP
jgi:transcriptional regulator with XRE-family HTH domain